MTIDGPTVVVVGAGYEGKRRYYERLARLGARLVIVEEPGHWSESLADQIAGTRWVATPFSGDPDVDAATILGALERSGVRADGVLTFWEDSACEAARAFGFRRGVLHVEGKCTSRGPRVVEVNSRMGGSRIHQMVEAVWGVDLIEAQLRSCLDLPQALMPSRKPRCAVVDAIVYAPATGRLAELPFAQVAPEDGMGVELDIYGQIGQEVAGPDSTFATVLAELTLSGKNLRHARRRAAPDARGRCAARRARGRQNARGAGGAQRHPPCRVRGHAGEPDRGQHRRSRHR